MRTGDDDRRQPDRAVRELNVRLPAAWRGFHQQFYPVYLAYAELQLGDRKEAEELVHRVFVHLAVHWNRLMREEAPAAAAWAILKAGIAEVLIFLGRQPAMPETAAFRKVCRKVLSDVRDRFAVLESAIGLYTAIADLPERQFDVIVLQYVLGHRSPQVAQILGVAEATVRSHRTAARRKLGRELGLHAPQEDEERDVEREEDREEEETEREREGEV
ncbi:RNA polymerase sigma factor [Streptomyces sp. YIM 98790]|uniref:RNA polymerase sigma factor n=1 Tax=Streptomyces sp. YIM 98790 TaxID=2689077 RepID=UPI001408582B|nr:sigma-70 family RNA polymerase sigma factor [Streptomyces sp. YIM 98790]